MATSGNSSFASSIPHNKTDVLEKFTAVDFGPLNVLDNVLDTFRSGGYYKTTPKESLLLHRLYGKDSKPVGGFWTVEKYQPTLSTRHDLAISDSWNDFSGSVALLVPRGIELYEGPAARIDHAVNNPRTFLPVTEARYLGGGWQVFLPNEVSEPLLKMQEMLTKRDGTSSSSDNRKNAESFIQKAIQAQQSLNTRYFKQLSTRTEEYLNNYAMKLSGGGNQIDSLPANIRSFLRGNRGTARDVMNLRAYVRV